MSVEYIEVIQGTIAWLKLRLGKITATGTRCLMVGIENSIFGKGALTYLDQKIKELRTGVPKKGFSSVACDFGKDWEDTARGVFELVTGLKVEQVGFAINSNGLACSPDGLVGDAFLIEIKCPHDQDIFLKYVEDGEAPPNYLLQMLHQLIVTERGGCYFFAYDPRTQDHFKKLYTIKMLEDLLGFSAETYTNRMLLADQVITMATKGDEAFAQDQNIVINFETEDNF